MTLNKIMSLMWLQRHHNNIVLHAIFVTYPAEPDPTAHPELESTIYGRRT